MTKERAKGVKVELVVPIEPEDERAALQAAKKKLRAYLKRMHEAGKAFQEHYK